MSAIAVIDFETSGLLPEAGGRATEVAIVLTENGRVVARYQSLMNAGVRIPSFITELTGIDNAMLREAPPAAQVMLEAARFVGDRPLVAHNASFDRKFWQSELARVDLEAPQPFACTVLLSRRLYPDAPNHKLGTLADFHALPRNGRAHRALSDAEVTAELLLRIQRDLRERHGIAAPGHDFLQALQQCSKATLPRFWQRHACCATA
ncbi:PolC-type DNA polymerase III [Malikia sp.]|uniref:3'-5' exonuclease n=1 Tax=Malikia sp. TaxID=2070706 RepID=UPI002607E9C5|nr:3'-5' exonuclease [Malikia sp.]MDD2729968.1 3'-5' exonuclease [Malikia sp.]